MVTATQFLVLDPTSEPVERDYAIAPGVTDLAGKRIGLLHNNKRGGQKFLDLVADLIAERYQGVEFIRDRKLDVSSPAPAEVLDRLLPQTDLVITAIGD